MLEESVCDVDEVGGRRTRGVEGKSTRGVEDGGVSSASTDKCCVKGRPQSTSPLSVSKTLDIVVESFWGLER